MKPHNKIAVKAIWVTREVHKEIKLIAVEIDGTMSEALDWLLKKVKANDTKD